VRRILFAPPAAEGLARDAPGAAAGAAAASARVSVLFANGTFGVWELDANMELRQARPPPSEQLGPVPTTAASCAARHRLRLLRVQSAFFTAWQHLSLDPEGGPTRSAHACVQKVPSRLASSRVW